MRNKLTIGPKAENKQQGGEHESRRLEHKGRSPRMVLARVKYFSCLAEFVFDLQGYWGHGDANH